MMALLDLEIILGILLWVGLLAVLLAAFRASRTDDRTSADDPNVRARIDGDLVYEDDRINDLLYAHSPDPDVEELDFDPATVETTVCSECESLNRQEFTYCRQCGDKLES